MQRNDLLLLSSLILGGVAVSLIYSRRSEIVTGIEDIEQAAEEATATAIEYGKEIMTRLTRGERNNNPGNIVKSNINWRGKVPGADSRFETFDRAENGIRAVAKILQSYYARGLVTIRQMLNTYAPPAENDTGAYVAYVSRATGIDADQRLNLDRETLTKLVTAIITYENGRLSYAPSIIDNAMATV